MKKIIVGIIAVIVVLGGGYLVLNKTSRNININKSITLTKSEINKYDNLTDEFFDSLNDNNFNEYKKLSIAQMANKKDFDVLKEAFIEKNGEYEKAIYNDGYISEGIKVLKYKGKFKDRDVNFNIDFENNNLVSGVGI